MKKINTWMLVLALLVGGMMYAAAETPAGTDQAIVVTDGIGKTITLDKPIEKAVVYDRYNTEVFRVVGAYDTIVGVDQNAVDTYPAYWTGVGDKIQIVGSSCTDYNVEKLVAMKPDAVFMSSLGEYESVTEQLAAFGIPVIIINAWIPSEYYNYIRLVAQVTGNVQAGEAYVKFCEDAMKSVEERVAKIPQEERKTVYFENGGEYKTCLPGSGWHDMVTSAGGINIFAETSHDDTSKGGTSSYQIDPEAILAANPDVLIENVYSTQEHSSLEAYVTLSENEMEKELARFVDRPGWANLDAVKNKSVYGFTSFVGNANSKLIAIMYIAKWLYPDSFADVDPDGFMNKWLEYMNFAPMTGHTAKLQ